MLPARKRVGVWINCPNPYTDELLASVWARVGVHLGRASPKGLLELVYGYRQALAIPDLPSRLALAAPLFEERWGLCVHQVIERHTLAPYYGAFRSASDRDRTARAMELANHGLHTSLGVCASRVRRVDYFRLCERCAREDLQTYGETFWRRSHHLPGVLACAIHAVPLLRTGVPFRALNRHEHIAARNDTVTTMPLLSSGAVDIEMATAIAQRSTQFLTNPPDPTPGSLRDELVRRGLVRVGRSCSTLRDALMEVIGKDLLSRMFMSGEEPTLFGFSSVRYSLRRPLHPLRRIVLTLVLESRPQEAASPFRRSTRRFLSRDAELRMRAQTVAAAGHSVRRVARELGVAWKTAARLLQPETPAAVQTTDSLDSDRKTWRDMISANPECSRTQLRTRARALYARLYRHDRAWLMAKLCSPAARKCRARVDWVARDRCVAARIREKIAQIRALVPPERASRSRVLGELQLRPLLSHRARQLPDSVSALAAGCESTDAYQFRKLRFVMYVPALAKRGHRTTILRAARINPDRFADGGESLIARARGAGP